MQNESIFKGIVKLGSGLPVINEHAAGIDIGDTLHYVAINSKDGGHEVKSTSAFTCDLDDIVAYLKFNGITTAALESTGVYWIPLYLKLEEAGIEPYLVNAKHVKNVTGRKKDDTDAIWIQKLHACGLLQKSFQPDEEIRVLRTYTRLRKEHISTAADCVRRMQKALELMNIKIHTVISDILGKTGMEMLKAIINGERNPEILSMLCDIRIKAPKEEIIKSLEGIWKEEYLFILKEEFEIYEYMQTKIKNCDVKIKEQLTKQVALINEGDITEIEKPIKKESKAVAKKNQLFFKPSMYLHSLIKVDLCLIPGISEITALEFLSEVGLDMSKWKSAKHFAAWLNLSPNSKISGGKILSNRMQRKKNKAGQYLKQAASCMFNSKSPLGDYYRIMRGKLGGKGAVLCTAHKLARIIYTMILNQKEYDINMVSQNQAKSKQEKIKKLEKQIERLKNAA
jgi:transposase